MHQLAHSLNLKKGKIKKWYENRRYQSRRAGLPVNGEEFSSNIKSFTFDSE